MGLKEELIEEVRTIFRAQWQTRDGLVVPEAEDLVLGNQGVTLPATVLYADMDGSTNLVDTHTPEFAAEVYKTYLRCAAKIIRSEGGAITAYDGDRIMAIFIGDGKNSSAARTALKINWAVRNLVNPLLKQQYPDALFDLRQVVGIDTSKILATRTGVRGANDLVWVGRAANYAAKLSTLGSDYPTWITKDVFDVLNKAAKFSGDGRLMWEARRWTVMNDASIYRSNFWWPIA